MVTPVGDGGGEFGSLFVTIVISSGDSGGDSLSREEESDSALGTA